MHPVNPFVLYYEPLPLMNPGVISGVCARFGLRVVQVDRSQVGESVGFLAGYQGFPPKTGAETEPPPQDRVLVFCETDGGLLDDVLEALKSANAPRSLKAVLTGSNAAWSFARLSRELSREHRAMGGASSSG